MRRNRGMSSHCEVPYWKNQRHQRQEQVEGDHHHHHHQEGIVNNNTSSHDDHMQNQSHSISSNNTATTTSTTNLVPLSNYHQQQVTELTWENGQIAMHGLLPSGPSKPIWVRTGGTLESVVHQATGHTQGPNNDAAWTPPATASNIVAGKWAENPGGEPIPKPVMRKRGRAEADPKNLIGRKQEEEGGGPSASASATFCRDSDTTMVTWASFESLRSLKNKTADEDSTSHGCLEIQDEDGNRRGESGRSNCTRRSRAAAVHNQSERRRRDRINQKMKSLQKLVPNASKTDKASMLDEVIEYLKQLQAQVQMMSSVRNMAAAAAAAAPPPPPMMMMMPLGMQQMSMLAAARMGMGMGMGMLDMGSSIPHSLVHTAGPTFVPPPFMMPQAKAAGGSSSSAPASLPMPDPYSALLAKSMYNKMAALYSPQVSQATQAVSSPSRLSQVQAD